jgi:hypothetical protein
MSARNDLCHGAVPACPPQVPRHVCYGITKALIAFAGFPAPPGITAYELRLPVFVFESVIVPWSCLVSGLH